MSQIIHLFQNVDLRCQHDGLGKICLDKKINPKKLSPGEYAVFTNNSKDRVKLFAAHNVIAYLRLYPGEGKIDPRTIQYIPKAFESTGKIDYDKALKEFVTSNLIKKKKLSPLEAASEIKKLKEMGAEGIPVSPEKEEILEEDTKIIKKHKKKTIHQSKSKDPDPKQEQMFGGWFKDK